VTAARVSRRARANLITDARQPASADLASRQIRYTITMAFRVLCFIAMIWVPTPYKWVLLVAAVVLPYVAVVFANQADERSSHGTFEKGSPHDQQLPSGEQLQIGSTADPDRTEPQRYPPRSDDIEGEAMSPSDDGPAPDDPDSSDTTPDSKEHQERR
jgi:hypothetical protein